MTDIGFTEGAIALGPVVIANGADDITDGVYFLNSDDAYVLSFTINGFTGFNKQMKIKKEYLPDDLGIAVADGNGVAY